MEFAGPSPGDIKNVYALNRAFLDLVATDATVLAASRRRLPNVVRRLFALDSQERRRLARTPFLLMSFREDEPRLWDSLLGQAGVAVQSLPLHQPGEPAARLLDAGLGFVWQLAQHNRYAARVICGAGINWCEQLAGVTLVELLQRAARYAALLSLRRSTSITFWQKLLVAGTSDEQAVRQAARLSVMQTMLVSEAVQPPLRAAACRLPEWPTKRQPV